MFKKAAQIFVIMSAITSVSSYAQLAQLRFTFQPDKPCRVLDTRSMAVHPVPASSILNIKVRGVTASESQSQGGEIGCRIDVNAKGIAVTLSAINPATSGHIVLWAFNGQVPNTSSMLLTSSHSSSTSLILEVCKTPPCTSDISLFTIPSSDFTMDIVGFYYP